MAQARVNKQRRVGGHACVAHLREHAAPDERREDRSVRRVHPRPDRVVLDQHRVAVQQAASEHLDEREEALVASG